MRQSLGPMWFDEPDPATRDAQRTFTGGEGRALANGATQGRRQTHRPGHPASRKRGRTTPGA